MKSKLKINTSFVSPITLKMFIEKDYLPIFIIRNISNSSLIGKYSNTSVHFKELSPSNELFRDKRDNKIDFTEFSKRYIIEISHIDLKNLIKKLEQLTKISGAKRVVLLGYGSDDKVCHRSILASLLNESGLLEEPVTELIV